MLNNKIYRLSTFCLAACIGSFSVSSFALGKLQPSVQVETRIGQKAATTQKSIDRLSEQTIDMNADYKSTLIRIEQFQAYNKRLELSIAEQEKEMASIQEQMNTVDDTERGLMPLMEQMISSLEQFVSLDIPFRKNERLERVSKLNDLMLRADVSTSEKYRQILDAYIAEIKYGNSAEVYEDTMKIDNVDTEVQFLMFGRTSFVFATRGENAKAGVYHNRKREWIMLSGSDVDAVLKAIKDVERKSKKLIEVPVISPEEA